ncbi:MAG: hypothetical protein ABI614_02850 [Planctomycetota bacterium]
MSEFLGPLRGMPGKNPAGDFQLIEAWYWYIADSHPWCHAESVSSGVTFHEQTKHGSRTMKWQQWIEKWGLTGLSINAGFLGLEFSPQDADRTRLGNCMLNC